LALRKSLNANDLVFQTVEDGLEILFVVPALGMGHKLREVSRQAFSDKFAAIAHHGRHGSLPQIDALYNMKNGCCEL